MSAEENPPFWLTCLYLDGFLGAPFFADEHRLRHPHSELGEFHGWDRFGHELHCRSVCRGGLPSTVVVDFGEDSFAIFDRIAAAIVEPELVNALVDAGCECSSPVCEIDRRDEQRGEN